MFKSKMKLTLAFILVVVFVSIDANPRKDGNGSSRARNRESSSEEGEQRNDREKNSPNHKGYKSKYPFPLFKSCLDFNVEYAMRRTELKRNQQIWAGKCKTGGETEQELCKSEGISTIRCSLSSGPSEKCIQEINDFLSGISCEADGGETEGEDDDVSVSEGDDNESTKDQDIENDGEKI